MRTGHMSVPKGKMAVVHMRDGTKVIGKFVKNDKNRVYLEGRLPIEASKIRTVSIRVLGTHIQGS